jgi:hypothetical protein
MDERLQVLRDELKQSLVKMTQAGDRFRELINRLHFLGYHVAISRTEQGEIDIRLDRPVAQKKKAG